MLHPDEALHHRVTLKTAYRTLEDMLLDIRTRTNAGEFARLFSGDPFMSFGHARMYDCVTLAAQGEFSDAATGMKYCEKLVPNDFPCYVGILDHVFYPNRPNGGEAVSVMPSLAFRFSFSRLYRRKLLWASPRTARGETTSHK